MKLGLVILALTLCGWSAEVFPTPKNLSLSGQRTFPAQAVFLLNRLGDDLIPLNVLQGNLRELGAPDLPLVSNLPAAGAVIIIGSGRPVPDRPEGYSLVSEETPALLQIHLSGHDRNGIIYAAVTLSQLLSFQDGQLTLPLVSCEDYPDVPGRFIGSLEYHFRKVFMYRTGTGCEEAKRYIDWAVNHKINILSGPSTTLALAEYITPEAKQWLREVNDYARARGITVFYYDHFNVGRSDLDNGKPEFAECVELRGLLFDWGFDELLVRKMTALNAFLRDTGYNALFLHSVDTTNSRWSDRGPTSKARFGECRLDADANAINIFHREFKSAFPDGKLFIVPRPYTGNLHYPNKLREAGELNPGDDLERFSRMIPQDIYICKREATPADHQSWKDVFKQPLFTYIENKWGRMKFQGAPLAATFLYCRGHFKPGDQDYFYYASGWPQDVLTAMGGLEYSWNLDTPGGMEYRRGSAEVLTEEENRLLQEQLQREWDPFGPDRKFNPELAEVMKKACRRLFGDKFGPNFYSTALGFIRPNLVFDTRLTCDQLATLGMPLEQPILADWLQRIAEDCRQAITDLESIATAADVPLFARRYANTSLASFQQTQLAAAVLSMATRAEIAVRNQQPQEAQRLIVEARAKYDQGMAAFPAIWQQLGKRESFYALSGDGLTQLRQIGGILHLKEIAVAGRLGRNPTVQKKATLTGGRPELVTIGLYNPPGGLMFGAKGLQDLLSGIADFRLEVLSDLQMSTLKKYSVVVFPDCKRFGQPTPQVEELREFVFDYGGGIYFEHDSCGYQRFPLQTGIFPEMGELQQMVGKLLRAKDYDPADRQLRIRADGRIFQQCYLDHCVFENCRPEHVWVEDLQGRPVWLAAPLGNGRVVYNGGITYAEDDSEIAASAIGPDERKLILQAVRWASGKSGHQAKILNVKKSEEVQTDAIRDVISFNLYLHPAAPIENASLTAECYRSRDRLKLQTVARLRLPERLDEEWESEELFQVATVPAEEIILVLTLNDLHGQVSWEFPVQ